MVKLTGPNCNTVVRKGFTQEWFQEHSSLDFTMTCCEPGLTAPTHGKLEVLGAAHYVGKYKVCTVCKGAPPVYAYIELLEGSKDAPTQCRDANLAISCSSQGREYYQCWKAKQDGTIEIFPAGQGLLFAGGAFTLWKQGSSLIGYSWGWTDAGCNPPICHLELTPLKDK